MKLNDALQIYAGPSPVQAVYRGADLWWTNPEAGTTLDLDIRQAMYDSGQIIVPVDFTSILGDTCYATVNWIDFTLTFTSYGDEPSTDNYIVAQASGTPVDVWEESPNQYVSVDCETEDNIDMVPFSYVNEEEGVDLQWLMVGLTTIEIDPEEETIDYTIVNGFGPTTPQTVTLRFSFSEEFPLVNLESLFIFHPSNMLGDFGNPSTATLVLDSMQVNYTEVCGGPLPRLKGRGFEHYIDANVDPFMEETIYDIYDDYSLSIGDCSYSGYANLTFGLYKHTTGSSLDAAKVELLGPSDVTFVSIYGPSEIDRIVSEDNKTIIIGATGSIASPTITGGSFTVFEFYQQFVESGSMDAGDLVIKVTPLASDEEGTFPTFDIGNVHFTDVLDCVVEESKVILSNEIVSSSSLIDLWAGLESHFANPTTGSVFIERLEIDVQCTQDGTNTSGVMLGPAYNPGYGLIPGFWEFDGSIDIAAAPVDNDPVHPDLKYLAYMGCTSGPPTTGAHVTGFAEADGVQTISWIPDFTLSEVEAEDFNLMVNPLNSGQALGVEEASDTLNEVTGLGGTFTIDLWDLMDPLVAEGNEADILSVVIGMQCVEDGASTPSLRLEADAGFGIDLMDGSVGYEFPSSGVVVFGVPSWNPVGFKESDGVATVTLNFSDEGAVSNPFELTFTAEDTGAAGDSSYEIIDISVEFAELAPSTGEEFEILEVRATFRESH